MFSVRFDNGIREFAEAIDKAKEKSHVATAKAINDLAEIIKREQINTMRRVFKSPRPATLRNIKIFKASVTRLSATIAFDQIYGGDEYVLPLIHGGARKKKPGEKLLGHYYVPGPGARMDNNGNIMGGQIQQMISRLGRIRESGYAMNQTKGSKKRNPNGPQYFAIDRKGQGLAPGVYQRVDKGQGQAVVAYTLANRKKGEKKGDVRAKYAKLLNRGIIPVILFVDKPPMYRKIFPFYEVGNAVVARDGKRLLDKAVASAIKRGW